MDCVYIVHVGVYVVFAFCVVNHYCGWFVLMIVGFMVLVGAGYVWNEKARVAVEWRCGMVGGDDCG